MVSLNICALCILSTMICLLNWISQMSHLSRNCRVSGIDSKSSGIRSCAQHSSVSSHMAPAPGWNPYIRSSSTILYSWVQFRLTGRTSSSHQNLSSAQVENRRMVYEFRSFSTIAFIGTFSIKTIRVRRTYSPIIIVSTDQICSNFTLINVQANCRNPWPFDFINIIKSIHIVVIVHCIRDFWNISGKIDTV